MSGLITFLCEHGLMLLGGGTVLLAGGSLAAAIIRSPAHRQRIAECSVAAAIVWTVLACVPMRRVDVWPVREPAATGIVPPTTTMTPAQRPPIENPIIFDGEIPPEVIVGAKLEPQPLPATLFPATSPQPPVESKRAIRWDRVGAWTFVAGMGVMAGWLLAGRLILRRMIGRGEDPAAWLADLLAGLPEARRLRPRLVVSRDLSRPVSFGLWRPCILLPSALAAPARRACVRQVLLHELAHLYRGDAWGNLVLNAGMVGLYFHPLYWWLRAQAGLSRELVADDWAAQKSDRQTYAGELIALARMGGGGRLQAAATIGILGSTSQFYRRIHMLLDRHTVLATQCSRAWRIAMAAGWSFAVIGAAALMGVRPAIAQNPPAAGNAHHEPAAPANGEPVHHVAPPAPAHAPVARDEAKSDGPTAGVSAQDYAQARELDRLTEAEFKLSGAARDAENAWERAESLVKRGEPIPEIEKAIENDPAVNAFAREIFQLKIQRDTTTDQFGKDHANVKKIERLIELTQSEIDNRRQELRVKYTNQLVDSLKTRVAESQANLKAVQKRLAELRRELDGKVDRAHQMREKALVVPGASRPVNLGAVPPGLPRDIAVGGVQLDLVNLANSAVNAVGALHLAEADLAHLKPLFEKKVVSTQELSRAESDLQTARRRVDLFRGLVKVSLAAAERELKTAHAEVAGGLTSRAREDEAATKIEMLKLILGSME